MFVDKQLENLIENDIELKNKFNEKKIKYTFKDLKNTWDEEELLVQFLQFETGYSIEMNIVGYLSTIESVYNCKCYDFDGNVYDCPIKFNPNDYINLPDHIVNCMRRNVLKDILKKVLEWFDDQKFVE